MTFFDHISQQWAAWVLAASWQLALLVCIVAVATTLARGASPRLRHALWLLVLLKVFLPPLLSTPISVGWWAVGPLADRAGDLPVASVLTTEASPQGGQSADAATVPLPSAATWAWVSATTALMLVWALGCFGFWAIVLWRYVWLIGKLRLVPDIDEGPLRVLLERTALELKLRRLPDIVVADISSSPLLFGVWRPRIVLPEGLIDRLQEVELRAVLAHELVHWKRFDTWIGWLQVVAQSMFWFHPFVWWANRQLRHERECACDEAVLQLGRISSEQYCESVFRVLTASKGRSLVAGSLVGVFERGSQLQNRLEDVMHYESHKRSMGWMSGLLLVAFAVVFLPMSPGAADNVAVEPPKTDVPVPVNDTTVDDESFVAFADETAKAERTPYPQIAKTDPEIGATGVDPKLAQITVTFDRDMGGGMSWTGGPPNFPPVNKRRKVMWKKDKHTCVLPVRLAKGRFYRLGINSKSNRNFKSTDGVSVPPAVIYFTTAGASKAIEGRVQPPEIVESIPENGSSDVDPATAELRVTFNVPMGEGMSWTGSAAQFPDSPEGKDASWSEDGKTCILPIALDPGREYQLGLNSFSHNNFQSKWGVPLKPVRFKFRTADAN